MFLLQSNFNRGAYHSSAGLLWRMPCGLGLSSTATHQLQHVTSLINEFICDNQVEHLDQRSIGIKCMNKELEGYVSRCSFE